MSPSQTPRTRAVTLAGVAVVVAALYFARTVCIPLALAILLSFLLAPLVVRLRRWGLGRITSVIASVGTAFIIVGLLAWFVVSQLYDVAADLPQYETNIQKKVHSFAKADGGILGAARHLVRQVNREMDGAEKRPSETEERARSNAVPAKPIPVEIHRPESTPIEVLRNLVKSLAEPLATAGIVIVFVLFMLVNREDLRDRLIRLIGVGDLNLTTQALDDAAQRVSRFLLSQLIINVCFAIPVGIALFLIGIPNGLLWGLLAGLFRFVPYVGVWMAASVAGALALAVDPGWSKLLETAGVFLGMELITYNFIEPWRYSNCTGISSIAVLVAAIFWTWLWGPIGLLLSTPLTVCLVVLGRYVPHLEFLSVLLGDEPVLSPEARYYQRLLAMDADEANDLAEEFVEEHSLRELYEQILIPALSMAEEDRQRGMLDPDRQRFLFDSMRALIQELNEQPEERHGEKPAEPDDKDVAVLCLPAADEADELAALMLARLLKQRGVSVKTAPASALTSERLGLVEEERVTLVCISALPPGALTPAKYLCKRLRTQLPEVRIIVGYWQRNADLNRLQERIDSSLAEGIVTSLQQAVEQIAPMAPEPAEQPAQLLPANEHQRLEELQHSGLLEPGLEEVFDRTTRELAGVFNVAIAAAAFVDEHEIIFKSHFGLDLEEPKIEREGSPCSHIVDSNAALSIPDVSKDPRFARTAFLRENKIRFHAGVPLRSRAGLPIGVLCLMDHQPRRLSERELTLFDLIARQLMEEVQWRREGHHHEEPVAAER